MKKIFVLALVLLFVAGVALAAGPSFDEGPGDILGQGKYPWQAHKIFRLVHVSPGNNDSTGIAAGSVVVWDDLLDDGISVETTTTSGDGRVAGILVTTVASGDVEGKVSTASDDAGMNANWGWLQTYGLNDNNTADTVAVTAGQTICAGATAGTYSAMIVGTTTTNGGILGSSLQAAAASGEDSPIFITCD